MSEPRGYRNKNPGNIRKSNDAWQGLSKEQPDKEFFTFTDHHYGIRALVKVILNYQAKYNLGTIRQIINRWAPPVENNTNAYVSAVSKAVGVGPDCVISMKNKYIALPVAKAIIQHELGKMPYTDEQIAKGVDLALK